MSSVQPCQAFSASTAAGQKRLSTGRIQLLPSKLCGTSSVISGSHVFASSGASSLFISLCKKAIVASQDYLSKQGELKASYS